jgi:hypothetical protein
MFLVKVAVCFLMYEKKAAWKLWVNHQRSEGYYFHSDLRPKPFYAHLSSEPNSQMLKQGSLLLKFH